MKAGLPWARANANVVRQYSNDCFGQISLDCANRAKYSKATVASPWVSAATNKILVNALYLCFVHLANASVTSNPQNQKPFILGGEVDGHIETVALRVHAQTYCYTAAWVQGSVARALELSVPL